MGQIDGLPINPRQWTKGDVAKIAKSLEETPELFEARPIIAVAHGKKLVILGGNLRFEGAKHLGLEEVPCVVFPENTPIAKMREVVIKDNSSMGEWDYDELANSWDDLPLTDWGVPAWDVTPEQPITAEERKAPAAGNGFEYEQKFGVIVTCKDELEQKAVFERLTGEGFECRVVCV